MSENRGMKGSEKSTYHGEFDAAGPRSLDRLNEVIHDIGQLIKLVVYVYDVMLVIRCVYRGRDVDLYVLHHFEFSSVGQAGRPGAAETVEAIIEIQPVHAVSSNCLFCILGEISELALLTRRMDASRFTHCVQGFGGYSQCWMTCTEHQGVDYVPHLEGD